MMLRAIALGFFVVTAAFPPPVQGQTDEPSADLRETLMNYGRAIESRNVDKVTSFFTDPAKATKIRKQLADMDIHKARVTVVDTKPGDGSAKSVFDLNLRYDDVRDPRAHRSDDTVYRYEATLQNQGGRWLFVDTLKLIEERQAENRQPNDRPDARLAEARRRLQAL